MALPFAARFLGVTKVYRRGLFGRCRTHALRGLSLDVPAGEVFGLVGPNRAGKTTLVKILLSICLPTAGQVERLGRPWKDRSTLARVGYLHDAQAFPRYLSAVGLLEFYGALSWMSAADVGRRIPELLDQVGLADRAREPISGFSKGMVQRLALAQALLNDPDLLVLDEPTEGMDLLARQSLHDTVRRRRAAGKTTIFVSHNMLDIERLCDRVAVIRQGELAFEGTLNELTGDSHSDSGEHLESSLAPLYEEAAV